MIKNVFSIKILMALIMFVAVRTKYYSRTLILVLVLVYEHFFIIFFNRSMKKANFVISLINDESHVIFDW